MCEHTLNDEKASDAISKLATSTRSKNSMKWSLYSSALYTQAAAAQQETTKNTEKQQGQGAERQ